MKRIFLSAMLLVLLAGCGNSKSLPGGFHLLKWEDGATFYLTGPGSESQSGGGAIEGTVLRLAWTAELIAADRYATYRGDPDGWMIIDTKTNAISGPLSEEQFAILKTKHRLRVRSAQDAWAAL